MLELMKYEGCGNCPKRGNEFDCKAHTVPVIIKFYRAERWDNWGHMVIAFRTGDVVEGTAVVDGNKVYCAGAESPIYEGINDFVGLGNVEITLINQ